MPSAASTTSVIRQRHGAGRRPAVTGGAAAYWRRSLLTVAAVLGAALGPPPAQAQGTAGEKLRQETAAAVRARLSSLLSQYCKDACDVVDIKVDVAEQLGDGDDLGFEAVAGEDPGKGLYIEKVTAVIQVDERVTAANRDRLLAILKNNLQTLGTTVDVAWRPVTLPEIGQSAAKEEQLKRGVEQRVTTAVERVIETFCPDDCVLSAVAVYGKLITPDEAEGLPPDELVRDKSGSAVLHLDAVDVEVGMDSGLASDKRAQIANVLKAKTRFAQPLALDVQVTAFPESEGRRQAREQKQGGDPYGLDKLRQTLRIFRELAGTKEVVTTNSVKEASSTSARERLGAEGAGGERTEPWQYALYAAGLLVVGGLVVGLVARLTSASRDARLMMLEAGSAARPASRPGQPADAPGGQAGAGAARFGLGEAERRDMGRRLHNEELRSELVRTFLDQPRVAKETFSRLLQEEGIEETARFVHIFGHLVIFELLGDPNLAHELYELSEYYHKSAFDFSPEEEAKLLTALKTRVTANEIRVLTRRQMDKFDFLLKLDATQIYNLIAEEKPQIQSIVLTQLDHKRRRAVFDMYVGRGKVDLMRELCRADAFPKEFLSNVAKALQKKVASRPEFDTENLRSSDILLDLLEKAELTEQRALMQNLVETNPEAARGIRLRLVTVELLPYLKDGHLLEMILGMERDDLLVFLAGTRDHIRGLVLAKAPEELAESWVEDLANLATSTEQNYRLVELKVLSRVRNLANNGVINLLDLNDLIFGAPDGGTGAGPTAELDAAVSSMVA